MKRTPLKRTPMKRANAWVVKTCSNPACMKEFEIMRSRANRGGGKYCSRDCWRACYTSPATRSEVRDRISAAKSRSGKSSAIGDPRKRQRQLENAGFTLAVKGETRCRNCGQDETQGRLALHHAIPRSMWKAGILDIRNGIPLCVGCHMGWHQRKVVICRDIFTTEEWDFISQADLLGQDISAWLEERYPSRASMDDPEFLKRRREIAARWNSGENVEQIAEALDVPKKTISNIMVLMRKEGWDLPFQESPTYCPQGHLFTNESTGYNKSGWRYCRICHRDRERQRRLRAKIHD